MGHVTDIEEMIRASIVSLHSTYSWCFWPRRCYKTKRWIFCEVAIKQTRKLVFSQQVAIRWYKKHEWLILKLKGEV